MALYSPVTNSIKFSNCSALTVVAMICLIHTPALAQLADVSSSACGSLENAYGPFDYTDPVDRQHKLRVVEEYHFTNDVYALRRGRSGTILGDIQYTLHAFPNHHLALDAMARLHERAGVGRLPGGRYSLECWFNRASRFSPTDGAVPMIYGVHLLRTDEPEEAESHLHTATKLMPESAEAHYNLGLLYVRLGRYSEARAHASRAYDLGFPLPGLREQLNAKGHWDDNE